MRYAIICNARSGFDLGISHLAMVDRRINKCLFWTSDNCSLIMSFSSSFEAETARKKIKYNNPQVVSFKNACEIIKSQEFEIMHNEASMDNESGWGGHKNAF